MTNKLIIDVLLETRMYSITMRHLSGIQKGIQALHSTIEYSNIFGDSIAWKKWATIDKTKIVLEGNVYSENGPEEAFNIYYFIKLLEKSNIPFAIFKEPDFSNAFTSVSFILDERYFMKIDNLNLDVFGNINDPEVLLFWDIREYLSNFKLASN